MASNTLPILNFPGKRTTVTIAGWKNVKDVKVKELTPEQFQAKVFGTPDGTKRKSAAALKGKQRLVANRALSRKKLWASSKSLKVVL